MIGRMGTKSISIEKVTEIEKELILQMSVEV